jgi:hypothetical protein
VDLLGGEVADLSVTYLDTKPRQHPVENVVVEVYPV